MRIIVVGASRPAYFLARSFSSKGHQVTVVVDTAEDAAELARRLHGIVVCGDGSDPRVLADAEAGRADVVIAATGKDQDNLVVCQLARVRFGVSRVLCLVNDPDNEATFLRLGVPAFSLTGIVTALIEQRATIDEVTNLAPAAGGKVNISEVVLTADSPLVDRAMSESHLPEDSLVACVLRGEEAIVPRGATVLRLGDRIVLITLPLTHGRALRFVTGHQE